MSESSEDFLDAQFDAGGGGAQKPAGLTKFAIHAS